MDPTLRFVIALVALILFVIEQVRAQGRSLLCWGAIGLAVIHVVEDWDSFGD